MSSTLIVQNFCDIRGTHHLP